MDKETIAAFQFSLKDLVPSEQHVGANAWAVCKCCTCCNQLWLHHSNLFYLLIKKKFKNPTWQWLRTSDLCLQFIRWSFCGIFHLFLFLNSSHTMQPDLASIWALISEIKVYLTVNQFIIFAYIISSSDICTVLQNLEKPGNFQVNGQGVFGTHQINGWGVFGTQGKWNNFTFIKGVIKIKQTLRWHISVNVTLALGSNSKCMSCLSECDLSLLQISIINQTPAFDVHAAGAASSMVHRDLNFSAVVVSTCQRSARTPSMCVSMFCQLHALPGVVTGALESLQLWSTNCCD